MWVPSPRVPGDGPSEGTPEALGYRCGPCASPGRPDLPQLPREVTNLWGVAPTDASVMCLTLQSYNPCSHPPGPSQHGRPPNLFIAPHCRHSATIGSILPSMFLIGNDLLSRVFNLVFRRAPIIVFPLRVFL